MSKTSRAVANGKPLRSRMAPRWARTSSLCMCSSRASRLYSWCCRIWMCTRRPTMPAVEATRTRARTAARQVKRPPEPANLLSMSRLSRLVSGQRQRFEQRLPPGFGCRRGGPHRVEDGARQQRYAGRHGVHGDVLDAAGVHHAELVTGGPLDAVQRGQGGDLRLDVAYLRGARLLLQLQALDLLAGVGKAAGLRHLE